MWRRGIGGCGRGGVKRVGQVEIGGGTQERRRGRSAARMKYGSISLQFVFLRQMIDNLRHFIVWMGNLPVQDG